MDNITDQLAKLAAKVGLNDEANTENPYRRSEDYIAAIAEYLDDGGSFAPDITSPQDGDTLVYNATQQKWVNGAGGGGAGGALVVHADENDTLDKTWKELSDAFTAGYHVVIEESIENDGMNGYMQKPLYIVASGNGNYFVMFGEIDSYTATTENGYPTLDK